MNNAATKVQSGFRGYQVGTRLSKSPRLCYCGMSGAPL